MIARHGKDWKLRRLATFGGAGKGGFTINPLRYRAEGVGFLFLLSNKDGKSCEMNLGRGPAKRADYPRGIGEVES